MKQNKYQKLELTWVGKGEEPQLEPRILIENPEYSYGDKDSQNMIIHGDNLLALKALEQEYAGKVKCIYIDPPYNTGSAFEYYDDNVEHSIWLELMKQRLVILRTLLFLKKFDSYLDKFSNFYFETLLLLLYKKKEIVIFLVGVLVSVIILFKITPKELIPPE